MSVVATDAFVYYLTIFVDYENACGCQVVAKQIEDIVCNWHRVIARCVEDWELDAGLTGDLFCTREIIGADGEYFSAGIFDAVVVSLQLN